LPGTCVWNAGDIIIGGAGSDTITGRNGNDLIDGDAVLQTWVSIPSAWGFANEAPSYVSVPAGRAYVASIARVSEYIANNLIDSDVIASLQIVRLIAQTGHATENDVAVFQAPRSNYTITVNTNGTITVTDTRNALIATNDGTDTLRNIETLRFSDGDLAVSSLAPRAPGLVLGGTVGGAGTIAVTWTAPALLSGTTLASYTARVWTTVNRTGTPAATCTTTDGSTLTCTISALAAGRYYVDVIATNPANVSSIGSTVVGPVTVSAAVAASLSPTTQNLNATKDSAISATTAFTPTGFTGTITYTIAGTLPSGLSIDSGTGVISGKPTTTLATTAFTITATAGSTTATSIMNITVSDPAAAVITPGTQTVSGTQNSAISSTTAFSTTNFTGSVTYSIAGSVALPTGLSFNTSTGVLSGTPSTTLSATVFTVTATDGTSTSTATISITVAAASTPQSAQAVAPTIAPTGATVTAANGSALVTWSAVPGVTRYTAQAFSSPTSTRVIRQCSVNGTGGASTFSCSLPRLQSFSTYYVDVVARNSAGAISSGSRISVVIP